MSLSHHEQRALEQIEADLSADDPWLASTLAEDGWSASRGRRRLAAAATFVAGVAMLASAILVPRSIPGGVLTVSVLGYLTMFHAALRWFTEPVRRQRKFRRVVSIGDD